MSRIFVLRLVLALQLAGTCVSFSQSPPAPSAPFFQVPQPGTMWNIDIGVGDSAQSAQQAGATASDPGQSPSAVRIVMKRGKNAKTQGTIVASDGSRTEFFAANGLITEIAGNSGRAMVIDAATSEANPSSFMVESFPALAWITKGNYVGVVAKEGADCYYFSEAPSEGLRTQAWIRVADKHPVEALVNDLRFRFSEWRPFEGDVHLPEVCQAALAKRIEEKKAIDALRSANSASRQSR